jgi:hypothetical protein
MGNLRQSMTDDEWNEIEERIYEERRKGKPNQSSVSIYVENLSLSQLKELKEAVDKLNLHVYDLDNWIRYREQV